MGERVNENQYNRMWVVLYKFSKPYGGRGRYRRWRRIARKSHRKTDHYIKHRHLIGYKEYRDEN